MEPFPQLLAICEDNPSYVWRCSAPVSFTGVHQGYFIGSGAIIHMSNDNE